MLEYFELGSNGFAQTADPDYSLKAKVEMRYLHNLIKEKFPIPDDLAPYCFFSVKAFPHDFGTYHEIVICYDERAMLLLSKDDELIEFSDYKELLDDNSETEEPSLMEKFWNFVNILEDFDMESDDITETIKSLYLKSLDLKKAEHLNLIRKTG